MKENTLKKLKSILLNRRREILEQVAHLEFEREELGMHWDALNFLYNTTLHI